MSKSDKRTSNSAHRSLPPPQYLRPILNKILIQQTNRRVFSDLKSKRQKANRDLLFAF